MEDNNSTNVCYSNEYGILSNLLWGILIIGSSLFVANCENFGDFFVPSFGFWSAKMLQSRYCTVKQFPINCCIFSCICLCLLLCITDFPKVILSDSIFVIYNLSSLCWCGLPTCVPTYRLFILATLRYVFILWRHNTVTSFYCHLIPYNLQ